MYGCGREFGQQLDDDDVPGTDYDRADRGVELYGFRRKCGQWLADDDLWHEQYDERASFILRSQRADRRQRLYNNDLLDQQYDECASGFLRGSCARGG